MPIFLNSKDCQRFFKTMIYYQLEGPKPRFSLFTPTTGILDPNKKIVEIICYCLMPNHFHLLLCQTRDEGITEFLSKLSNSYTKYFNIKNNRAGHLLQGEFKAVHIETNEQLIHLTRYVHLNPLVNFTTKDLNEYQWSSYPEYIDLTKSNVCYKTIILEQFGSLKEYQEFVLDQEDYGKKLEMIKHQLIEDK